MVKPEIKPEPDDGNGHYDTVECTGCGTETLILNSATETSIGRCRHCDETRVGNLTKQRRWTF